MKTKEQVHQELIPGLKRAYYSLESIHKQLSMGDMPKAVATEFVLALFDRLMHQIQFEIDHGPLTSAQMAEEESEAMG